MIETKQKLMKEKILDAALILIKESGIDSISMRNLANELNISATALYRHYKNKNEILLNLCSKSYQDLLKELTTALANKTAFERLEKTFLNYYNFCKNNQSIYFLMIGLHYNQQSNFLIELNRLSKTSEKFLLDRITELKLNSDKNFNEVLIKNKFLLMLNGYLLQSKFDELFKTNKEIDNNFKKLISNLLSEIKT